jgi:HK97 family phage major capsid protein
MSTANLEKTLTSALKGLEDSFNKTLDDLQSASAEEKTTLEDRLKAIEGVIEDVKKERDVVERHTLPGCEPNEKTGEKFSISRASLAYANKDWTQAPFEKEVIDAFRQKAMSSGTDSAGGFLVPEEAIPDVIERLKAEVVALALGARELPASGAPLVIPRISTSATAVWMTGENVAVTASDLGFEQISMSPKTIAAFTYLSNQLVEISSPTADSLVQDDFASEFAIGIDQGILEGSGASGEPLGIVEDPNALTESITAGGILYTELVGFVDALAVANSLRGRLGWAMNPALFTQIMKAPNESTPAIDLARRMIADGPSTTILGYPYRTTTSLTGTSGVGAKSVVFGNWEDCLVAMWGGLRIRASEDGGTAFTNDQLAIRGTMRVDVAFRHSNSFCVAA